ncbi:MAG: Proteasome-associated ATPase [Verrucomicrobiae bacterium]|nr:Proteasome-associated ATPase [Verrucomicrobiae bacterium]
MSDHSGFKKPSLGGEHKLPHDWRERADDSPLAVIDRLIATTRDGDPTRFDLFRLRRQVEEHDLTLAEARTAIEKMDEVIKKVTAPANRIGTFLGLPKKELAHVAVGGHDYFTNVDPRIDVKDLKIGTRVLVNEAYVVVGDLGYDNAGPVGKITDVLKDGRLRVGQEHGAHSVIVHRSTDLIGKELKSGDEIRIDPAFRVAVELLTSSEKKDFYLEDVPELAWSSIGGQTDALNAIKDAIELPLIHGDLFERFKYAQPKGFLLHGPPGCGKTLIGKATAFNLTKKLREKTGQEMKECFMHVKGPEILNMWVGESERIVREIFATAREKRRQGFMPFLFIDEAESILGVRRASRYSNILSTLVPMFCSEMDGIESLHDVVIILASNRADLIDPAILRPGRIDRKIKVNRPDKDGAREIFSIYLNDDLPLAAPAQQLVDSAIKALFNHRDENRFLEVQLRSGRKDVLYRGDLLSGAIIESIVARAKEIAIKHSIDAHKEQAITEADLLHALDMEFSQNDIFPPTDIVEDWLMLIDHDPENVVKVSPIRPQTGARAKGVSAVV